jgi:hypothetical protein
MLCVCYKILSSGVVSTLAENSMPLKNNTSAEKQYIVEEQHIGRKQHAKDRGDRSEEQYETDIVEC